MDKARLFIKLVGFSYRHDKDNNPSISVFQLRKAVMQAKPLRLASSGSPFQGWQAVADDQAPVGPAPK